MTLTPNPTAQSAANSPGLPHLSAIEARVLATLMEKARTVPDSYPLSLNSLVLGCNQKTSREPFMEIKESEAVEALAALREQGLVRENHGGRVTRFEHNAQRGLGVPEQSAVLLGLLMLRGPQTAAELRLNSERWYRFADISSVEGFLEEMQDRSPDKGGPMVVKLARAPGAREQRWAHLLCGPVENIGMASTRPQDSATSSGLEDRVAQLEAQVAQLKTQLQGLMQELGLSPSAQP
jgi:uncharacterized protein YceH (UPF0502 family)